MKLGTIEEGLRYQPDSAQLELAAAVAGALDGLLPLSRVHGDFNESPETWSALDELGLFNFADNGEALSLSAAEEALILLELGRRLAAPSVLATIGASHAIWPEGAVLAAGRRVAAAYREGERVILIDDPAATHILLRGTEPRVCAVPRIYEAIDSRLWAVTLAEASDVDDAIAKFSPREMLRLKLLDAAALAGLALAALEMAVAYANLREQFGRPIGSFQAVKHRCARMALASRSARDLATFAAVAFDDQRPDAPLLIEEALFIAGAAALENAGANIQIHGGIGFSDEADPHLLLKRAQVMLALAGGLEQAAERVAEAQEQDGVI